MPGSVANATLTHAAQQGTDNSTIMLAATTTPAPSSNAAQSNEALGLASVLFALVGATAFAM
jgi:hypothetical protein